MNPQTTTSKDCEIDTQILLPGQAIVSVENYDRKVSPYGSIKYSALCLEETRKGLNFFMIEDDYSIFDFTYYLASKKSIKELVNFSSTIRRDGFTKTGFSPESFSDLERLFDEHKDGFKPRTIYMVSLRGGRINYI